MFQNDGNYRRDVCLLSLYTRNKKNQNEMYGKRICLEYDLGKACVKNLNYKKLRERDRYNYVKALDAF